MKRSLDYQLCKRSKGVDKYCKMCICTWTFYYEAASLCFKTDPEYKARVMAEQQQWDDDSLTYCNRQAQKYSLDAKADDYCGAASLDRGVHIFAFLSTIAAFLWLSSM